MTRPPASEKLPGSRTALNVKATTGRARVRGLRRNLMSYAEAKEIALLRLELRASWNTGDRVAAGAALARLTQVASADDELAAEVRRWRFKLEAA
jgi:hypothetical protein